jgi:hypothetical protein
MSGSPWSSFIAGTIVGTIVGSAIAKEHHWDREVIAAVYQRFRAASGLGYKFEVPPDLRRAP